jgi:hypothetical protein
LQLADLAVAIHRAAAAVIVLSTPSPSSHLTATVAALRDAHITIGFFVSRLDLVATSYEDD